MFYRSCTLRFKTMLRTQAGPDGDAAADAGIRSTGH